VTLVNTKGMAFFGPGSEWFWAALQFTALAITFIAIYRQLQSARSARAVEQVEGYRRQLDGEQMARYQLAILVAIRDRQEIPDAAGLTVGNYFETLGSLSREGHVDMKLLWNSVSFPTLIWWTVLEATQTAICERALTPSLSMMCRMWLATVASEMKSRTPICLLLSPSAINRATSSSRFASGPAPVPSGAATSTWLDTPSEGMELRAHERMTLFLERRPLHPYWRVI
jgi:hypothetical protein